VINLKKITVVLAILMIFILNDNQVESIIIPNEAIRVRVIANSNEDNDIEVKENVKKDVSEKIYGLLKNVRTIDEARKILQENIPEIDITVERSLKSQNYHKNYSVNYGLNYFPEKKFKGVTYSEGYYESLVVSIGEAKGDNWWCVLFPPLCMLEFEDIEKSEIDYKSFVGEMLDKYINN